MEDTQRIVKCGSLSLQTPGGFFKKRWHSKYLVLYDGSKSGVKRLELFDSEIKFKKQLPAKIIPLIDCVRIVTCQRHKTTFTFEVRTNEQQFYLFGSQSFQDMNDWVNCLRLVAFGQAPSQANNNNNNNTANSNGSSSSALDQNNAATQQRKSSLSVANSADLSSAAGSIGQVDRHKATAANKPAEKQVDMLLLLQKNSADKARQETKSGSCQNINTAAKTASQAAAAAASALAKTRQRQPSLLGSCKPLPPDDSPFIQTTNIVATTNTSSSSLSSGNSNTNGGQTILNSIGQVDTLTPTVRGQLIATCHSNRQLSQPQASVPANNHCQQIASQMLDMTNRSAAITCAQVDLAASIQRQQQPPPLPSTQNRRQLVENRLPSTLDEEEENMLYCSIEDNPSEHNYRVKVIETELALRCQLKCYQLSGPSLVCEQYEELSQLKPKKAALASGGLQRSAVAASTGNISDSDLRGHTKPPVITFYQLIIGPQQLVLLNDYATLSNHLLSSSNSNQQGLWSWPYQCIRRYGFDKDNCFMFEAGRKCASGPGQFIVQTPKAYNIYQDVVKFVNELRTIGTMNNNNGIQAGHLPSLEIGLQSGAEAGTRRQKSVTQIPVIWTPEQQQRPTMTEESQHSDKMQMPQRVDNSSSRQQFFSALKRFENNTVACNQMLTKIEQPPVDAIRSDQSEAATSKRPRLSTTSSACSSGSSSDHDQDHHGPTVSSRDRPEVTNIKNNSIKSVTRTTSGSDETDESGYEQGDDQNSIDGSQNARAARVTSGQQQVAASSRDKKLGNNQRHSSENLTRQQKMPAQINDNSRPTSRHSAEKKPVALVGGQSLADRVRALGLHELVTDNGSVMNRTPKIASTSEHHQSIKEASVASIIAPPAPSLEDDFEANLIRDVYCEITKLHAKFAVTTNGSQPSTDDSSLSSRSSLSSNGGEPSTSSASGGESSSTMSLDNNVFDGGRGRSQFGDDQEGEQQEASPRNGRRLNTNEVIREPLYSNLQKVDLVTKGERREMAAKKRSGVKSRDGLEAGVRQSQYKVQSPDKVSTLNNDNCNNSNSCDNTRSHARRVAPIHAQQTQIDADSDGQFKSSSGFEYHNIRNGWRAMSHQDSDLQNQDYNLYTHSRHHYPTMLNPIPESGDDEQTSSASNSDGEISSKTNGLGKPQQQHQQRKPTNHYVINDVQYAKISRNLFR